MKYPYFRGLEADRYSFYRVPKALIKVDLFEKMSGDAKLLYAVLLDRMNLSLKNGWQDENGNAYIICTIDEIMDSIRCARQKAVKLLDELEHEYQLIERRRQGLGKPNLLYVKDLYAGLSQSNYWKKDVYGSDKGYNFCYPPQSPGSRHVAVFEAPIDALSHATLQELEGWKWNGYRLSLGGTSHVALTSFLERHPEIRRVTLYMDHDLAGFVNARKIKTMLHEDKRFRHIRVSVNPPRMGKDYNEKLLLVREQLQTSQHQRRPKEAAVSI